jgi:hypothetical protein
VTIAEAMSEAVQSPVFLERFWDKIDAKDIDECWLWTAACIDGYGTIRFKKRSYVATRIMYLVHNGFLNPNLLVRHTCDNPSCCNPQHLILGTYKDNTGDAVSRGRTNRGSKNPKAKLTEDQVNEIRALHAARTGRDWGRNVLALELGIGPSHLSRIVCGDRYLAPKEPSARQYLRKPRPLEDLL